MISRLNFLFFVLAHILLIPGISAFYFALKGINKNAMIIATGIMGLFIAVDIGITEMDSLALVTISQNYLAAASEAQRSAFIAAANYGLAILPIATFFSFFVSSVGLVIIATVMLKGVFMRVAALVGIVAGIEGIAGAFYVLIPSLSVLLIPCLITFALWSFIVGIRFNLLGWRRSENLAAV
jgi:hypothetical protein